MEPIVELTVSDRLYGQVTVTPVANLPVQFHAGIVNWAELSLNPRALDRRLSAGNLGISGKFDTRVGTTTFNFDQYRVSDGNSVATGSVRLMPAFHLLSQHLKPVIGIEMRDAARNVPEYWSPSEGYGTGFVGVQGEWGGQNWTLSMGIQRGTRLWGEAGKSWGGSLSATYRLNKDWSVGFSGWGISNVRDNKPYRFRTGALFLERRF